MKGGCNDYGVDGFPAGMENQRGVDGFPAGMENRRGVDGFPAGTEAHMMRTGSLREWKPADVDGFPAGMRSVLWCLLMVIPMWISAQGSSLPLGSADYHLLDRLEIKSGTPHPFFLP